MSHRCWVTAAGGGLCSPLFDLVHIVFSVRLLGVQVFCLSLRLRTACYCFLPDKVWEPANVPAPLYCQCGKLPDQLIRRWLNLASQNPAACFSTSKTFEKDLWTFVTLESAARFVIFRFQCRHHLLCFFQYWWGRVAKTQGLLLLCWFCWLWISQNNRQGTFQNKWIKNCVKTEIMSRQKEANRSTGFALPLLEVEMKTRTGKNRTSLSGFWRWRTLPFGVSAGNTCTRSVLLEKPREKNAVMLQFILIENSRKYFNANIAAIQIHSPNFVHPSVTDIFTKLHFHFFFFFFFF